MLRRVFHLISTAFLLSALILLITQHVALGQSTENGWAIEHDIDRLLSNDEDSTIYQMDESQADEFNGTFYSNFSVGENASLYWNLPADAPLPEQPVAETQHSQISTKNWHNVNAESPGRLKACKPLQQLPLSPLYDFIAHLCGFLIFGGLSCIWVFLICLRKGFRMSQSEPGILVIKCGLILGTNIHATACLLVFLMLQALSKGVITFSTMPPKNLNGFCNFVVPVLDVCTSVFWFLVGLSNTLLIIFLHFLKPGRCRTEAWTRIVKTYRNSVFLCLLIHCVPWICAIALSTIQLIFLNEISSNWNGIQDRGQLIRALTSTIPVLFATLLILTRIWKFQGHRLHLPSVSRSQFNYNCDHQLGMTGGSCHSSPPTCAIHLNKVGQMAVALFSSSLVTGLHFVCSLCGVAASVMWIVSLVLPDIRNLSSIHGFLMYISVCLFYSFALAGYSSRLTLATAITDRNSYIPGETLCPPRRGSATVGGISPQELLEIPTFTRTQFFDSLSEASEQTTEKPLQFITVYKPIVS